MGERFAGVLPPLLGYADGLLVADGPSYVSVNDTHKAIEIRDCIDQEATRRDGDNNAETLFR